MSDRTLLQAGLYDPEGSIEHQMIDRTVHSKEERRARSLDRLDKLS